MTMCVHDAKRFMFKPAAALIASAMAIAGLATTAWADTAPVGNAKVAVPSNVLSVGDIESRLAAQGFKVKEIEVRDLIAEIEAYDPQGREVELIVDRRNGETLAHKYDR